MRGYTETYRVNGSQADMWGHLKYSTLLQMFQDTADRHTAMHGVSNREMQENHGASWVVAKIWIRLHRPIRCGDTISVATYQRPLRGTQFVRDTEIRDEQGEIIGEGVSVWILIDRETHAFLGPDTARRITQDHGSIYDSDKTAKIPKMRMPEDLTPVFEKTFMYSDTDMNGHVNNTRYLDAICDACRLELEPGRFITELQLGYKVECRAGETVTLLAGEQDGSLYAEGRVEDGLRFEAKLTLADM